MKIGNTRLSKRTLALLAATALLFGSGGYAGTKAELEFFSNDYTAEFELDHLHVHLIENGQDVCHGENDIYTVHRGDSKDGSLAKDAEKNEKYKGNLVEYLGYKNDTHKGDTAAYKLGSPGKVEPGRTYKEEISAKNGSGIDQYVRLTLRKYWVKDAGKDTAAKDTTLSPDLIKLTYNGKAYNSGAWTLNKKESTDETSTYYLNKMLKGDQSSALLFNELTIDGSVADEEHMTVTEDKKQDGNKTVIVYTYSYDYNGYTFCIEADVQAIQTHNVNDAIDALWGVSNVSAKNGTVTVK